MKVIFKNRNGRLRSGWKIAIVIVIYLIFQGIISVAAGVIIGRIASILNEGNLSSSQMSVYISKIIRENQLFRTIFQLIDFIILMSVIYFALRIMGKKRFRDIGFSSLYYNYKDLVYGLFLGTVSMSLIFFILFVTGNISIANNLLSPKFSSSTFWGFILFIIVGIKEEALTRGYCINVLNQMGKPWLSVIISSVVFSLLHFFNPNVRILGLVNIVLVGILFGYMYIKTRNLWMPIGYHITWNFFQGEIFGLPVSGGTQNGIYSVTAISDNLLTGGNFGPEAGILTTGVIIIGLILVWMIPKNYSISSSFKG